MRRPPAVHENKTRSTTPKSRTKQFPTLFNTDNKIIVDEVDEEPNKPILLVWHITAITVNWTITLRT
jgi:ferric iron reductase protein FhuF